MLGKKRSGGTEAVEYHDVWRHLYDITTDDLQIAMRVIYVSSHLHIKDRGKMLA